MIRPILTLLVAGAAFVACDDGTGPEAPAPVSIAFATTEGAGAAPLAGAPARAVTAQGSNGTLEITAVALIVSEFELEGADDACLDPEEDDEGLEDCAEFEAPPFLLELPLDGSEVTVVTDDVTPGTYDELEFEVEDVELDEDDEDEQGIADVRADALALHDDWPDQASMVIEGTFTPADGGAARPFRVFAEAEIEVERELEEPLVVVEDGVAQVTVLLDPSMWFTRADGTVVDLSEHDYTGTDSDIIELEAEFEDGLIKVEVDDD